MHVIVLYMIRITLRLVSLFEHTLNYGILKFILFTMFSFFFFLYGLHFLEKSLPVLEVGYYTKENIKSNFITYSYSCMNLYIFLKNIIFVLLLFKVEEAEALLDKRQNVVKRRSQDVDFLSHVSNSFVMAEISKTQKKQKKLVL